MNLQTRLNLEPQAYHQITYDSELLLFGSCFTEHIAKKLSYFKFRNSSNTLGILFHPKAIETLILNAINEKDYTDEQLVFNNELWHSFDAHSVVSNTSKNEILAVLNGAIKNTKAALEKASHIVITLGSAWVYRHIETDQIVANCHKIPQKKFLKEILSVDEIQESIASIIALIKRVNHDCAILFTVSPVRHLKDGFVENTRSKAHLIAALHQQIDPRKNAYYFPAYELVLDQLRDYRFFEQDMMHPNATAIDYIWEQFTHVWIAKESKATMETVDDLQKGFSHKAFHPETEKHQLFLKALHKKMETLQKAFPFIHF